MAAIIIKVDTESNKILTRLAKKLGGSVININDEQFEDFALGTLMDREKTGEIVPEEEVLKKLRRK